MALILFPVSCKHVKNEVQFVNKGEINFVSGNVEKSFCGNVEKSFLKYRSMINRNKVIHTYKQYILQYYVVSAGTSDSVTVSTTVVDSSSSRSTLTVSSADDNTLWTCIVAYTGYESVNDTAYVFATGWQKKPITIGKYLIF